MAVNPPLTSGGDDVVGVIDGERGRSPSAVASVGEIGSPGA